MQPGQMQPGMPQAMAPGGYMPPGQMPQPAMGWQGGWPQQPQPQAAAAGMMPGMMPYGQGMSPQPGMAQMPQMQSQMPAQMQPPQAQGLPNVAMAGANGASMSGRTAGSSAYQNFNWGGQLVTTEGNPFVIMPDGSRRFVRKDAHVFYEAADDVPYLNNMVSFLKSKGLITALYDERHLYYPDDIVLTRHMPAPAYGISHIMTADRKLTWEFLRSNLLLKGIQL